MSVFAAAEHVSLAGLQAALDAYIDSDADARPALAALGRMTVAIELTDLQRSFFLCCNQGSLKLSAQQLDDEGAIDAHLSAPLKDFIALGLKGPQRSHFSALTIRGDMALARQLWNILTAVDCNCESLLAPYVGDVIAHELGRSARAGSRFLQRSLDSLAQTTAEYLQEELRLTPNAFCVQDFVHNIDVLRDDIERLEAGINRLATAREQSV